MKVIHSASASALAPGTPTPDPALSSYVAWDITASHPKEPAAAVLDGYARRLWVPSWTPSQPRCRSSAILIPGPRMATCGANRQGLASGVVCLRWQVHQLPEALVYDSGREFRQRKASDP
jgi:hypothetical protein